MLNEIKSSAEKIKERLIALRRHLHKYPELSGEEKNTSRFIAGILEECGMEVKTNVGGYGVVGLLQGGGKGPQIALRADMDALPIYEKNHVDYHSKIDGVMHACGHDVHTSILLGASMVLGGLKENLDGSIKFIFQPSEERSNGGAMAMLKQGVFDDPAPEAVVALHCYPHYEAGSAGIKGGVMTASSDSFRIVIRGKGGHAARPNEAIDAILLSAMAVNSIHHIVSRRIDPTMDAVISIGKISGGTAPNIVAETVEMEGTVRTFDKTLRMRVPVLIEETLKGVTSSLGGGYEFNYEFQTPSVVNDEKLAGFVKGALIDVLDKDNVITIEKPQMGAEDFAYFSEKVPGVIFRLGTGNRAKGIERTLHSATFDVDEDCIPTGTTVMSWIAAKFLGVKSM